MNAGTFSFDDISKPQNGGQLLLIDVLLNFANVDGRCGVEFAGEGQDGQGQTWFCAWDPRKDHAHISAPRSRDYAFEGQRFDDPEENDQFVDTDLLLRVRSSFEL